MAQVLVEGDELVVDMSGLEKVEGFHGDVRVPVSSVTSVRAVDSAWPELRGLRAPGTGIPQVIAVGTRRGSFGKDFAVVHGTGPAIVIDLRDADYERLIVTVDDAFPTAERLAIECGTRGGPA
ncbi:MAG TPA: hypothetical protein VGS21_04235 [Acidimicrobiales bacterium]|nr:hypothetical protein [Acidimicrobiales bacterium]